jgi:hypothetical protein
VIRQQTKVETKIDDTGEEGRRWLVLLKSYDGVETTRLY